MINSLNQGTTVKDLWKILAMLIIICVIILWLNKASQVNYARYKIAENAVVADVSQIAKSVGASVRYSFSVNRHNFEHSVGVFSLSPASPDRFIGRSFPVAYDTIDPSNSIILLTPQDFSIFHLQYPDSLKWVLPYLVY